MLVLWFSVSPDTMLLLYATLRDILYVRMEMFSSRFILSILESTLITIYTVGRVSEAVLQASFMLEAGRCGDATVL